jgi:hypothetical protein
VDQGTRHAPTFGKTARVGDVFTHVTTTCRYGSERPTEAARLLHELGSSWRGWVTNTSTFSSTEDDEGAPLLDRKPETVEDVKETLINLDDFLDNHPCQVEEVWTTVSNTFRSWSPEGSAEDSEEEYEHSQSPPKPATPPQQLTGAFPVTPELPGPSRSTRSQVNVGDNPEETPRRGTPAWDLWFAELDPESQAELASD